MKKHVRRNVIVIALVIGILCLGGGVYATRQQTDVSWAEANGYVTREKLEKLTTQAEFLRMVMTEYDAKEPGVQVPHGAENHWAAPYYATAKQEGLIDCSCQIKPDKAITLEEASKFVMVGINKKANKQLTTMEDVQRWVQGKNATSEVTYQDAATLLRNMSDMYQKNKLNE